MIPGVVPGAGDFLRGRRQRLIWRQNALVGRFRLPAQSHNWHDNRNHHKDDRHAERHNAYPGVNIRQVPAIEKAGENCNS